MLLKIQKLKPFGNDNRIILQSILLRILQGYLRKYEIGEIKIIGGANVLEGESEDKNCVLVTSGNFGNIYEDLLEAFRINITKFVRCGVEQYLEDLNCCSKVELRYMFLDPATLNSLLSSNFEWHIDPMTSAKCLAQRVLRYQQNQFTFLDSGFFAKENVYNPFLTALRKCNLFGLKATLNVSTRLPTDIDFQVICFSHILLKITPSSFVNNCQSIQYLVSCNEKVAFNIELGETSDNELINEIVVICEKQPSFYKLLNFPKNSKYYNPLVAKKMINLVEIRE